MRLLHPSYPGVNLTPSPAEDRAPQARVEGRGADQHKEQDIHPSIQRRQKGEATCSRMDVRNYCSTRTLQLVWSIARAQHFIAP
jgi:hypothetical protein